MTKPVPALAALAAAVSTAVALIAAPTAWAVPNPYMDPNHPDFVAGWCPGGGTGYSSGWCNGEPFDDGSYWSLQAIDNDRMIIPKCIDATGWAYAPIGACGGEWDGRIPNPF